jgi:hypothetical protein
LAIISDVIYQNRVCVGYQIKEGVWTGAYTIARMEEMRNAYRILVGNPEGTAWKTYVCMGRYKNGS